MHNRVGFWCIDPAAYVIEAKDDKDVKTRNYDPTIDK